MKQRLHNAVRDRADGVKAFAAPRLSKSYAASFALIGMGVALLPAAAFAQTAPPTGTSPGGTETYALGQQGSPAATDYFGAAQGFNASLAPLLTAILPVLVVILAIWQGPKLLKRLTTMMAH